ncbi:DUF202 domain-containing protein [Streptomyces sp. PH10-H1]|uniref:DUF202 domain-containing protein n=1 Tax=Streptomyces sp. PH10-H1 TaxID=3046212 RepID=UPI0024B9AE9D|nr:DUF202 domain-containing protein [Streptomyces sp. PH10-H1]MDJ0344564.1 DUF202 domain-containing protein [Streptomyces sp. PH10-H1]
MAARDRDPGLQPERTRLAWRRTTLSCAVAAVLAGRQAIHRGLSAVGIVGVALGALVWLVFLLVAQHRIRRMDAPRPPPLCSRAAAVVGCTVALAVFGAAVLW